MHSLWLLQPNSRFGWLGNLRIPSFSKCGARRLRLPEPVRCFFLAFFTYSLSILHPFRFSRQIELSHIPPIHVISVPSSSSFFQADASVSFAAPVHSPDYQIHVSGFVERCHEGLQVLPPIRSGTSHVPEGTSCSNLLARAGMRIHLSARE
jgi:hypothetical protein